MWQPSHGHGHGSHLAMLTGFFLSKWRILIKNSTIWSKKWVKKVKNPYQKLLMATMVALAAARRVKMAFMLENIFEILTLSHKMSHFQRTENLNIAKFIN